MINIVCGIRSTGRICTDLAAALETQGHVVRIAYGREAVPKEFQKYAVRIGSDVDVYLHILKARMMDGCGWGSKRASKKFIKWAIEYDPDIIHLHNIHGYYINLDILFGYLQTCGKKIIWTLHDCWAVTGHSAYCDTVGCRRWIHGCYNCPLLKEYPASIIDRSKDNWNRKKVLMERVPNLTIVSPSEWLAQAVRKSFLAQYPVKVIHNGINTSCFYPMKSSIRENYGINDRFMLLGVSTSWDEMKGYSDFLKLAALLGDQYQIVMVGVTKKQKAKLPGNILGIERTNNAEQLACLYSAADLFLNLSYCENYPTVNLEAIACGTPILTYRTGGSPESAIGGMVIERGDVESVKNRIIMYRKTYKRKEESCINRADIDTEKTLRQYMELLKKG